jgi:hypothetical protein
LNPKVKRRSGIASIIGGAFLILIIISSYAFFAFSNKATNDLQSTINNQNSLSEKRNQEDLSFDYIVPNQDNNGLVLAVINSGSIQITVKYVGINDVLTGNYDFYQPLGNPDIKQGDRNSFNIPIVGTYNPADTYHIKLITSTGRIFSFSYPSLLNHYSSVSSISITPVIQENERKYIITGFNFTGPVTGAMIQGVNALSRVFSTYLDQTPVGTYTITAADTNGHQASTIFSVTPYITLSPNPTTFTPNQLTIQGSGYPPASPITIRFNNVVQTPGITTRSNGTFTAVIDIIGIGKGNYPVEAKSGNIVASNIFTILS